MVLPALREPMVWSVLRDLLVLLVLPVLMALQVFRVRSDLKVLLVLMVPLESKDPLEPMVRSALKAPLVRMV
jgi:hypothetical protein